MQRNMNAPLIFRREETILSFILSLRIHEGPPVCQPVILD